MEIQLTSSTYIIEKDKVLLILHPKFHKWLPPGGHVEKEETPVQAAKREVLEETGFLVELINQETMQIENENAKNIEKPYLILLENIPPYKEEKAHHHLDFIYLATLVQKEPIQKPLHFHTMKWVSLEEALEIREDHIFPETKEIITNILQKGALV